MILSTSAFFRRFPCHSCHVRWHCCGHLSFHVANSGPMRPVLASRINFTKIGSWMCTTRPYGPDLIKHIKMAVSFQMGYTLQMIIFMVNILMNIYEHINDHMGKWWSIRIIKVRGTWIHPFCVTKLWWFFGIPQGSDIGTTMFMDFPNRHWRRFCWAFFVGMIWVG